jgi:hypothetical protein
VYNLIPYSFLVDYFTNIGDILAASCFGRVNLSWGCRTKRGERMVSGQTRVFSSSLSIVGSGSSSGLFTDSYTSFERNPVNYVTVGVSDFHFRVPGFDSLKWANIAGLANIRIPRKDL